MGKRVGFSSLTSSRFSKRIILIPMRTGQTMNEKEIRNLCYYLQELKRYLLKKCGEVFMRTMLHLLVDRSLTEHQRRYQILKAKFLSIRNLLSTQAALIHNLAEGVKADPMSALSGSSTTDGEWMRLWMPWMKKSV